MVIIVSFNIAKIPKNGKLSFHPVSPHHGLFKIFNQGNGKASWSFILISWEDYYIHAGLLLDSSAQYIPLNHFTSNIASSCVAFCKKTDWKVGKEHASGVTNHVEDLYITLSLPDTSPFKWERNGRHKSQPEDAQSIGPPTDWRAICHIKPSCFSVPAKDVAVSCISYCSIPPYPRSDTKVQLMFGNNDINIFRLCWLDQCQFVQMPYQSPLIFLVENNNGKICLASFQESTMVNVNLVVFCVFWCSGLGPLMTTFLTWLTGASIWAQKKPLWVSTAYFLHPLLVIWQANLEYQLRNMKGAPVFLIMLNSIFQGQTGSH